MARALIVLLPSQALAQQEAHPAPGLKVTVLEGEGALNSIRNGIARDIVIEVRDETGKPVGGATVTLSLPAFGPSGLFPTGANLTTVTDAQGVARARGFQPNQLQGEFSIKVLVSHQGRTESVIITQTNVTAVDAPPKGRSNQWLILLGIAAGGGAAAALALGGGKKNTNSSPPAQPPGISIVPGSATVGGPR
jgi:hypothetical protein